MKPSDYLTLNFTYQYHKMQTDLGEQSFYAKFYINPFIVAKELVIISPCNKVNNEAVIRQLEERAKTYARIYQDQWFCQTVALPKPKNSKASYF